MKIRHRLLWTLCSLGLLMSVGIAWASLAIVRASLSQAVEERVRAEADLLATTLPGQLPGDAQSLTVSFGRRLDMRVTLIAPDGNVVPPGGDDERMRLGDPGGR